MMPKISKYRNIYDIIRCLVDFGTGEHNSVLFWNIWRQWNNHGGIAPHLPLHSHFLEPYKFLMHSRCVMGIGPHPISGTWIIS